MPKSKRSKLVSLTQTQRKGKEAKEELVKNIRECCESYTFIYIFSVENMRNTFLKDVRNDWKTSRFFFGKNRVMARALGESPDSEYKENLRHLASRLEGNVGLLFTDSEPQTVQTYFDAFKQSDYARSGITAMDTVVIPAGPLKRQGGGGEDDLLPHTLEPALRKLGMPTRLVNGVPTLESDYTLCTEGETLTPEKAQLLKHFWIQMAEFQVSLLCYYSVSDSTFHGSLDE
ncbi:ribosomal protein L10-domain-containing protein [Cladochytrium replicatum]|nr:ribosomal protein L10-domain-containing protein [Cladochytrium replicatum]